MIENSELWKQRAEDLLKKGPQTGVWGMVQAASSMLTALYGPESTQLRQFQALCDKTRDQITLQHVALAAISNAKDELEGGLIHNVRVEIAGEILAELIRLGKDALVDQTEEAKNVSAVLVSAAFEGLIRRMGEDFASVTGRPKLEDVVSRLKSRDVLKGGQVGTALSYLRFRNDSLHADWAKVDRSQVESCLVFVESLLSKHFS
jgi:hypothetical protein